MKDKAVSFTFLLLLGHYIVGLLIEDTPNNSLGVCSANLCHKTTTATSDRQKTAASNNADRQGFFSANCFCDSVCPLYEDCCEDVKSSGESADKSKYSCTNLFGKSFGVFTYNACPTDYVNNDTKEACEVQSDCVQTPYDCLPVLSLNSHIVYRNLHCAICNEGTTDFDSRLWIAVLHCRTLFMLPSLSAVENEIAHRVKYNPKTGRWDATFFGDPLVSEGCTMTFEFPPEAAFIRPCKPRIESCPSNWPSDSTRERCTNYTSLVYRVNDDGSLDKTYRNKDCAQCNSQNTDTLECNFTPRDAEKNLYEPLLRCINYVFSLLNSPLLNLPLPPLSSSSFLLNPLLRLGKSSQELEDVRAGLLKQSPRIKASEFSYALLMDSDYRKGGNKVGSNQKCSPGQVYNEFSKKCQVMYCGGRYDTNC